MLISRIALAGAAAVALVWGARVASAGANPDEKEPPPGLAIGTSVPDLSLRDHTGKTASLSERIAGKKLTALVFFRSAGW